MMQDQAKVGDVAALTMKEPRGLNTHIGVLLDAHPTAVVMADDHGDAVVYNWASAYKIRKATAYDVEAYWARRKGLEKE
jgi:hypothetical protein